MKLMREVRFCLLATDRPISNSWAGWPSATSAAPFMILRAIVSGSPHPQTGYVCNISRIDDVLRDRAVRRIIQEYENGRPQRAITGETLLCEAWSAIQDHMPDRTKLAELQLDLTPFVTFVKKAGEDNMVSVTESFEFSAAHRLFRPDWSDRENAQFFGKCANPNGHGHNYRLDVSVTGEPQAQSGTVVAICDLESAVKQLVIDRFDHKHLNLDCAEFKALNPSVENIAKVIWNLLEGKLGRARLSRIRVWETPKTYAEVDHEDAKEPT